MREIKFRAWSFYYKKFESYSLDQIINGKVNLWFFKESPVIHQYTGINDINNKPVYEGDILGRCFDDYEQNCIVAYDGAICCAQPIGTNKFRPLSTSKHNGACGWSNLDGGSNEYNFEVIGNTYENPELLK